MSQINKDIERILVSEEEINDIVRRIADEIDGKTDQRCRAVRWKRSIGGCGHCCNRWLFISDNRCDRRRIPVRRENRSQIGTKNPFFGSF